MIKWFKKIILARRLKKINNEFNKKMVKVAWDRRIQMDSVSLKPRVVQKAMEKQANIEYGVEVAYLKSGKKWQQLNELKRLGLEELSYMVKD